MTATRPSPQHENAVIRDKGSLLRVVHTAQWAIEFEPTDDLWISVELSDRYRVTGTAGSQKVDRRGTIGGVHINPPSRPIKLALHGVYRAVQMAIPQIRLARIAEEDHGVDWIKSAPCSVLGRDDPEFAALLFAAAAADDADEDGFLHDVVARLLAHYSPRQTAVSRARAGLSPHKMRQLREFVEANLATASLAAMAKAIDLSPYHFAREFKRITGKTPWAFVNARRLALATTLLEDRDTLLSDIARRCGFADASHLSHRMREDMGLSPSAIRTRLLI